MLQAGAIAEPKQRRQPQAKETAVEHSVTPTHRDRRAGLVFFGILEIIIGGFCLLLIPLLLLAHTVQAKANHASVDYRMIVPSMVIYFALAVTFVWLGIGSILCRRWARTLILFVAWTWLIVGIFGLAIMAYVLPQVLALQPGLDAGVRMALSIVAGLFAFVLYVALPTVLVIFYRSPHVRATCEAHDPGPSWTDSCPFPVLGGALSFALGALSLLLMPLQYRAVFPLFGTLISGPAAILVLVALGLISGWLAWGLFRMKIAAWWASIAMIVVGGVSTTMTLARVDLVELYREMGLPEEQLDAIAQLGSFGNAIAGFSALSILLMLAYMLWLKKYFREPLVSNPAPD